MRGAVLALVLLLVAACTADRARDDASPSATTAGAAQSGYEWQAGSGLPTPRTEVAVAADEAQIFVVGGFTADGEPSGVVEMFDASEGGWGSGPFPPLPEPLHHTAMVSDGGRLYVFGGYREDGSASSAVWSLIPHRTLPGEAPGAGAWQRRPDMPTARGAHAAVLIGGTVHVVGGASRFGGQTRLISAHEAYDLKRRTWSTLAPLPDPRDHLAAAAIGDDLYVVGGRKLSLARNTGRLDVFDTQARRWARGPDMPTPRGGIAAASVDDRLFVFGGEQPSGTFDETEIYEPRTRTWTDGPPMPTARHGLGAAAPSAGLGIAVVGGGLEPGLSVSDVIEFLVPDDPSG
jgi:N-acetylneuraminic acid mutarotase